MIPDCTVVTALYNLHKYHNKSLDPNTLIERINVVLELPVYLVIFTEKEFVEIINSKRKNYGFSNITLIVEKKFEDLPKYTYLSQVDANREVYWPSRDERTSSYSHLLTCSKFDFMLEIIDLNPFHTSKFSWLDSLLGINNKMRICENYSKDIFLNVLNNITDKFHIQILNVNDKKFKLDENKKDYYSSYKYVVCGCFFSCGIEIGRKIFKKLNESFIKITNMGFGHCEEPLYLEILDEYYDDIIKGYGDYGQIINNVLIPTCNINYVYNFIIQKYLNFHYHRECYDCCKKTLLGIEKYNAYCSPDIYMNILFSYFVSSFYHKYNEAQEIIKHIYTVCKNNSNVKIHFDNNKGFYESQFNYVDGYSNLKIELENDLNNKILEKEKHKIIISICVSGKNYSNEIIQINETWGKKCKQLGIKIIFFLGEEKTDLIDDNIYIYLDNINNYHESLIYKQNLGFKYIYDNYDFDYVYTCVTDTYLNIDKLLQYLDTLDKTKDLYIGGHGDFQKIGNNYIYYHFGGDGILVTKSIITKLYPKLSVIVEEWKQICINKNMNEFILAYDVLLGYCLNKFNCEIVKNNNFYSYQYMNLFKINKNSIILQNNNFFIEYIKNKVFELSINKTDISEHLPTLYKYASECESVFETGVNEVISSWAFAYGLLNNGKEKKQLFMNDITYCNIDELLNYTKNTTLKIDYEWVNNLQLDLKQNYDIVFIDTWHVYGQLKRELAKLSKYANKYIIMHDTTVDEIYGETIRNGWNAEQQSIESGFPVEEIKCGLWKAIEDFLIYKIEWKIKERYYNNNGLIILEKIK